jgi:hypothetical protein
MRARCSRFLEGALALAVGTCAPSRARAQACCAAGSALTPGRLALHEDALTGAQVRAGIGFASFDAGGHYATPPPGASEYAFEQDLFGAVRITRSAQIALLVPVNETRRQNRTQGAEFGGGVGDLNVSGRYDFTRSGESSVVPGIGVLAGLTLPTGTPAESATLPQATDATGTGAWQGNVGLALEQSYGPWLVNLYGLVALRAPRTVSGIHSVLGTQATLLAGGGYAFESGASMVLVASYTVEGDATVDGTKIPGSARRVTLVSLAGLWPLSDKWRLIGSVFLNPPVPQLGINLPATAGVSLVLRGRLGGRKPSRCALSSRP